MMGDNVNLAARMESGANAWGTYAMCTEVTKRACEKHGERVIFRPLGRVVVMGRSQPVPVYEIAGLRESTPPATLDCINLFSRGLEHYYQRNWDAAAVCFNKSSQLEAHIPGETTGIGSNPSLIYLEIVRKLKMEPPPEAWSGVFVMHEK
jgi:adenylate cyclase